MNSKVIACFVVLLLVITIPHATAQTETYKEADQRSVQVTLDAQGDVSVVHHIRDSDDARELKFIDGTIFDVEFIDKLGNYETVNVKSGAKSIIIPAEQDEFFVRYNLSDVLFLKDNVWTMDFRYLQTVTFVVPEGQELIFVNERPLLLEGGNAFVCHGCQVLLEYSVDQPRIIYDVDWEDKEFAVGISTFADVGDFGFSQPGKEIVLKVDGADQHVNVIIPLELLRGPYVVFLDGEKIIYNEYNNNETHVWLDIKPESSGVISIIGTTVVPEFPIIAPLAIGFLIILMMPFVKRFSLH